jgi:hypothetical protein
MILTRRMDNRSTLLQVAVSAVAAVAPCLSFGCAEELEPHGAASPAEPNESAAPNVVTGDEVVDSASLAVNNCDSSDCVKYDLSTQDICTEESSGPTSDIRWTEGLSTEVDQTILGGNVVAFKLQWFNGNWSNWYVVGANDIDIKYKTQNNTMRRRWSYFYDHTHKYIICKRKA